MGEGMHLRSKATWVFLVVAVSATAAIAAIATETTAQTSGPLFEPIAVGEADVLQKTKYRKGPTTLDFRRSIIPPGGVVPWHCHPGPTTFIVVRGELTTYAPDGSSRVLGPGDADVEPVGVPRRSKNFGSENVEVYISFAAPKGLPPTIWLSGPEDRCGPSASQGTHGHNGHGRHEDDTR